MGTVSKNGSDIAAGLAVCSFVLGLLPLLGFTFFSPGLRSEGILGFLLLLWGLFTLVLLIVVSMRRKLMWALVLAQILLLGGLLAETFLDAILYIGT